MSLSASAKYKELKAMLEVEGVPTHTHELTVARLRALILMEHNMKRIYDELEARKHSMVVDV